MDPLFEALCKEQSEGTKEERGEKGEARRLKKVVVALKKALDDETDRRKNSSKDYDNLKSDIKKLAIKLEADGQLFIPSADVGCVYKITSILFESGKFQGLVSGQFWASFYLAFSI